MSQLKLDVNKFFSLENKKWRCNYCLKEYKFDPTGSTSTRKAHVLKHHPLETETQKPELSLAKKRKYEFFPQVSGTEDVDKKIAAFFIEFNIPLIAANSETLLNLMKSAGKYVKVN